MDATMEDLRDESETPVLTEWQTKRLETEASEGFFGAFVSCARKSGRGFRTMLLSVDVRVELYTLIN